MCDSAVVVRIAGLAAVLALLAFVPPALRAEPRVPPVGAPGCVGCLGNVAEVRELYSPDEWEKLAGGAILIRDEPQESGPGATRAVGLLAHPPEQVWSVLTDFERWPEFMPLITRTEVVRRDGSRVWVRQQYRVVARTLAHTTIYDLARARGQLAWALDREAEHDIATSEGRWAFVPLDGGRRTLVRYRAVMDAGRAVPDFVETLLRGTSLRRMIGSLRDETARRYSDGGGES